MYYGMILCSIVCGLDYYYNIIIPEFESRIM